MSDPIDSRPKKFLSITKSENDAVDFLNNTIVEAIQQRVSDVHFQLTNGLCRVRFRAPGGALFDYQHIERHFMTVIDEKIRSRARLSTTDRMGFHSGRINLELEGAAVDIRIEISPGVNNGQVIVCRLLNQSNSNMKLSGIKMTPFIREAFASVLNEPNGLFLVTGPTGSGKTTTLYSLLNELNNESRNIITLENPVEYRIPEFNQVNIDGQSVTFAKALRSVLRQDPDVILVGEIRDPETALIAVQAAITGHLVLSTLHANNAAMAITRMLEFGVDPNTLAAALRGVTAQRLIRTVADASALERSVATGVEKEWLSANNIRRDSFEYLRSSNPKDYKGFIPVMEMIVADQRVKKSFSLGVDEIYAAASRQPQFETLAQAAERFAYAHLTTLDQAMHVSSIQEAPQIKNRRIGQVLIEMGMVQSSVIDELLEQQVEFRKHGEHRKIGGMLVANELCSHQDIVDAIGYTAEGIDILIKLCSTEDRRVALAGMLKKLVRGVDSVFQVAVDLEIVAYEELFDACPL